MSNAVLLLVAAGVVAAVGAYLVYAARAADLSKRRARKERVTLRARRRAGASLLAVAVALAAASAWAALASDEEPEEPAVAVTPERTPDDTEEPGEDDDVSIGGEGGGRFPVELEVVDPDGSFTMLVSSTLDEDVYVQCRVRALDEDGRSVFTRTWPAHDRDGKLFESRLYSNRFFVTGGGAQRLSVDLEVKRPIAEIGARCMRIPPPEELEPIPAEEEA